MIPGATNRPTALYLASKVQNGSRRQNGLPILKTVAQLEFEEEKVLFILKIGKI